MWWTLLARKSSGVLSQLLINTVLCNDRRMHKVNFQKSKNHKSGQNLNFPFVCRLVEAHVISFKAGTVPPLASKKRKSPNVSNPIRRFGFLGKHAWWPTGGLQATHLHCLKLSLSGCMGDIVFRWMLWIQGPSPQLLRCDTSTVIAWKR